MSKQITTLGISLGTRNMGIAILRDGELVDCRVKTFKGNWSKLKLKSILSGIQEIIKDENVDSIIFKTPNPTHASVGLVELVAEIKKFSKSEKLKCHSYSLLEIKKHLADNNYINKKSMAEYITVKFPELLSEYHKEKTNKNSYYIKMFEAVYLTIISSK